MLLDEVLPLLAASPGTPQAESALGLESPASLASKALLVEFLLELFGRFPVRCQNLVKKYSLHAHILPLVCYGDQHMVLWGVKFLRVLVGCKDTALHS